MRASEFVNESLRKNIVKTGKKLPRDKELAMPHAHRVAGTSDRLYDLGLVSQYVAGCDGTTVPQVSGESWAGRNNTLHPYTEVEAKMLKHAYKLADVEWDDVLKNSKGKSVEHPGIHKTSPVIGFRGYK